MQLKIVLWSNETCYVRLLHRCTLYKIPILHFLSTATRHGALESNAALFYYILPYLPRLLRRALHDYPRHDVGNTTWDRITSSLLGTTKYDAHLAQSTAAEILTGGPSPFCLPHRTRQCRSMLDSITPSGNICCTEAAVANIITRTHVCRSRMREGRQNDDVVLSTATCWCSLFIHFRHTYHRRLPRWRGHTPQERSGMKGMTKNNDSGECFAQRLSRRQV